MTVRRRRSDRSGRNKLHSPGRPDSARREELVRFWAAIATGRSSEDAARDAGVSPPVGSRWFRRSGGMPPSHLSQSAKPLSGRYLSFEEREEIALLRAQGRGIRHIACRLERAPSTISREVRRNAATRSGGLDYRATTAQWHADRSAKRPKPAKLATNEALRRYVQDRLAGRISAPDGTVIEGPRVVWNGRRHGPRQHRRWARAWSPEQIAHRLRIDYPGCQWRSKKGPPRRCKKGPLGGCGLVPVVHGRAPRATRRALNRLTRRRAREGPVGPRGQAWAGWSVQLAVGV